MTDTPSLPELALDRLRKQGAGNGLKAEDFEILEHSQKDITLLGDLKLSPRFDSQTKSAPGGLKQGSQIQMFPSIAALEAEIKRRKTDFESSKTWVQQVVQELKNDPTQGWGFSDALVAIPDQSATLGATDPCPQCKGQGKTVCRVCNGERRVWCPMCQGRKEEQCYHCQFTGQDPIHPEHPCPVCHGTKFAPCRTCQASGMIPCADCKGTGGTPCGACRGTGKTSQLAKVKAGALTAFRMKNATEQSSTLLRCLDQLGLTNLGKGHAEIHILDQKEEDEPQNLSLSARFSFTEVRLRVWKGTGTFGILGNRNAILGVPTFLDRALKSAQDKLIAAAKTPSLLPQAMKARAISEAVALAASGKTNVNELRKIYPQALSAAAAQEIMSQAQNAVKGLTRGIQIVAGSSAALLGTGLAALFLFNPSARAMLSPTAFQKLFYVLPPLSATLGWVLMSLGASWQIARKIKGAKAQSFSKPTLLTGSLLALDLALPAALLLGIKLALG